LVGAFQIEFPSPKEDASLLTRQYIINELKGDENDQANQ